MTLRLETPKQLAARVNLSERQVRHLIQTRQLDYVKVGSRVHIPEDAWAKFIETQRVKAWQDETKDPDSSGSRSESPTTSSGLKTAAAASARLVRQTANRLKSPSQNGSSCAAGEMARVIPLKS